MRSLYLDDLYFQTQNKDFSKVLLNEQERNSLGNHYLTCLTSSYYADLVIYVENHLNLHERANVSVVM